jgi:glycosyltransferase involved in cell wall biosynthesis
MYSVGAAKDLIVNNKNGYLMKTIDPFEISSLLKKIYLNRKKAKDIKFYGKYYLNKKYFSFNNTKKQFTKLIDEYSSN